MKLSLLILPIALHAVPTQLPSENTPLYGLESQNNHQLSNDEPLMDFMEFLDRINWDEVYPDFTSLTDKSPDDLEEGQGDSDSQPSAHGKIKSSITGPRRGPKRVKEIEVNELIDEGINELSKQRKKLSDFVPMGSDSTKNNRD